LAARDFGYIGLIELIERLEFTFASLDKLQKFRGHFFNWHDTRTLQPLWPQYVSTVDSGNLAGSFIALKQALVELPDQKLLDGGALLGMGDTLNALKLELSQLAAPRQRTSAITMKELTAEVEACAGLLARDAPETLPKVGSFAGAVEPAGPRDRRHRRGVFARTWRRTISPTCAGGPPRC
jgi:hypothetical protein